MGSPAAVMGDQITGQCAIHLMPNPASGVPQPSPPLPFTAPIIEETVETVLICGKPAAVLGSSGYCTPPHVGLHPTDPFMVPVAQRGQVVMGSATVLIGGQPAASQMSQCVACGGLPANLSASAATVLIGE